MRGCFPWLVGLFSAPALAQVPEQASLPVDLTWQGPEACSGASQTLTQIRQMCRSFGASGTPARVTVSVQVQPQDQGRWAVHVTTISSELTGDRLLVADSCDEARRAVALLVALMINPNAHFTTSEPLVQPAAPKAPDHEAAAQTQREEKPVAATQPPTSLKGDGIAARTMPRGFVGAHLVADEGTLPAVSVGGRLALGVEGSLWALAARVDAWARQSADFGGLPGAGARFSSYDVELAACGFAVRKGNAALQLCLGPQLHAFHASSYGVSSPGSASKLTWGAFGEVALRYRFGRGISLRVGLEGLVPLQRPKFVVEDLGQVFQQRSVAERVCLGPELEF